MPSPNETIRPRPEPSTVVDWIFGILLTLAFAALLLPRILLHVFWRDEWHVWLVASDGCSLRTLLSRVRYDGHPVTWYVLLWLGSHVWHNVLVVKLIHAAIATAAAFVIAAFAPFPRWQRAMLVFGYFFAFEYAVISRNYSMGALALLIAAAIASRRPSAYIGIGLALAAACQTNAFATLIALAFAIWLGLRWWLDGRPASMRFAIGGAIFLLSVALAFFESTGPADRVNTPWTFDVNPMRAGKMLAAPWRSVVPLPDLTRHWWSTNVLDATLSVRWLMPIESLLGIAVVMVGLWTIPRRRWDLRLFWLASVGIVFLFGYTKLTGSIRHHGVLVVAFVIARWLASASRETIDRRREAVWTGLLCVQFFAGLIASTADVIEPFSAARATADFIRTHVPDAAVIGQRDLDATCIAGELGRNVFFPTPGRWGTFIIWNDQRSTVASAARLDRAAEQIGRAHPDRPVLLVLSAEAADRPDASRFEQIADFGDATVSSERYTVYRWNGKPAPATRPGDQPG